MLDLHPDPTSEHVALDDSRMRALIAAGRRFAAELDEDGILRELLTSAQQLTGARHAVVVREAGPDGHRRALSLRLDGVIDDARAESAWAALCGDPVPSGVLTADVTVRRAPWARLRLASRGDGDAFDARDVEALEVLTDWAAVAAANAAACEEVRRRRAEAAHLVQTLAATTAITRAIGDETELARVLELVVSRGRRLIDARTAVISLPAGDELEIAAAAGDAGRATRGARIPMATSTAGEVLRSGVARRVAARDLGHAPARMGLHGVESSMLVPLIFRGRPLGVLAALDRQNGGPDFTGEDEELLRAFAASAAIAVATAQHVGESRLRDALDGAEQERRRWARELHDETLQGLAGLRMRLEMLERQATDEMLADGVRDAGTAVAGEIARLRTLITELRPAALDELGLTPALESLVDRVGATGGVAVALRVRLPADRLPAEHETAVYRIVQEALANVVKHAAADVVRVDVRHDGKAVVVHVVDDGRGVDPALLRRREGFGVTGMRERATLAGGRLDLEPVPGGGTSLRATLPLGRSGTGARATGR
ncbi:sensor histidine kinase [Patulibacter minatonensis]|uniref:sensor histidine kinase n=1 Tax=Patulibacter minatonensis TaxID=298163 RepID=UPI0004B90886|nr:GAF domain-containing sensor histidine kinase [Patulibacter minatonensis]